MKQVQCACGDFFFTDEVDVVGLVCQKCQARVDRQREENDLRGPVSATPATPKQVPVQAQGEGTTEAFNAALNAAIAHLRGGAGEAAPNFYVVALQNEDTGLSVVMATSPQEERAGHLAAVIQQAVAGKNIGFRVRVMAIAVATPIPRRVELVL